MAADEAVVVGENGAMVVGEAAMAGEWGSLDDGITAMVRLRLASEGGELAAMAGFLRAILGNPGKVGEGSKVGPGGISGKRSAMVSLKGGWLANENTFSSKITCPDKWTRCVERSKQI